MNKLIVPPVAVIAVVTAAVFYGLYAFSQTGVYIASFIFFTVLLLLCVLLLSLTAIAAAGKLQNRNLKLREQSCRT